MAVRAEQIAVSALRDWLLAQLPARVATVNATRAPVLKSPYVEPFNVTSGMATSVSSTGVDTGFSAVPFTTGSGRTAVQLAADFNAVVPALASADSDGHVLLTGTAPTSAAQSVALGPDTTGANALLGFDAGGEKVVAAPVVAPGYKGVADGLPVLPDMGQGFWIIIGRRSSTPVQPDIRRDEYLVSVDLGILHRETNVQVNRSREHIHSVVRCVRETLLTDRGRRLGREGIGDIVKVGEKSCLIDGVPFSFRGGAEGPPPPNGLFDRAFMQLAIRVFERPDTT
jgi:hypothetical protein